MFHEASSIFTTSCYKISYVHFYTWFILFTLSGNFRWRAIRFYFIVLKGFFYSFLWVFREATKKSFENSTLKKVPTAIKLEGVRARPLRNKLFLHIGYWLIKKPTKLGGKMVKILHTYGYLHTVRSIFKIFILSVKKIFFFIT